MLVRGLIRNELGLVRSERWCGPELLYQGFNSFMFQSFPLHGNDG